MRSVDYLVSVDRLPEDLQEALTNTDDRLYETACAYNKLVISDLLFPIWGIDEYQQLWVEVNFINAGREAEFHTLKIDPGTYTEISHEPYTILSL